MRVCIKAWARDVRILYTTTAYGRRYLHKQRAEHRIDLHFWDAEESCNDVLLCDA
jgi:hypothetical protein